MKKDVLERNKETASPLETETRLLEIVLQISAVAFYPGC